VPRVVTVSLPVTRPLFEQIEERLRQAGCEVVAFPAIGEFRPDVLRDADVLVAAPVLRVTRELMAAKPKLRAVISPFIGTDAFDEAAATDLGILVANGHTSENVESMAESTIMLVLAALYDLHFSEKVLRDGLPRPASRAFMLRGRSVGLLGYGAIARAMTVRLAGWGARLRAWSRRRDTAASVEWMELDELLCDSDVVCVLLSLNDDTSGLLNARRLRMLKPNAVLVNTARGGIIDEDALIAVARERPDLRIVLDVFETEPLPVDSPLRAVPNAILTPHMVGHTVESHAAVPGVAFEAVMSVLRGEPPRHVRNPAVIEAWRRRWDGHAGNG
jgi:phosphoglycerate dehydrogenase-like enzyme